ILNLISIHKKMVKTKYPRLTKFAMLSNIILLGIIFVEEMVVLFLYQFGHAVEDVFLILDNTFK
ncbi:MAG: hypothetical protein Q8Q23_06220, partial [bacterium]|nr:hypothetical protein [bacterium]